MRGGKNYLIAKLKKSGIIYISMKKQISDKIKKLPGTSGVYIMKDKDGTVIYVGKAKNLKNRVKSYFNKTGKTIKTHALVSHIDDFEYFITKGEADAFALECNLIKKHMPRYNVLLKDDKAYPYIKIDRNRLYPEILITRKLENDGSKYFGPFVTGMRVGEVMDFIQSAFPVRICKQDFSRGKLRKRPCLHGVIGKCSMPCMGSISNEDYLKVIDDVEDFLSGKNTRIKKILAEKMKGFADSENFEKAIEIRDKLDLLEKAGGQILASLTRTSNIDVFGVFVNEGLGAVTVSIIRKGITEAQANYYLGEVGESPEEMLESFIAQYYDTEVKIPREIIARLENVNVLKDYLSEKFNRSPIILNPKKGIKKQLLDITQKNAKEYLLKSNLLAGQKQALTAGALKELTEILGAEKPINRIEGYDISNISGTNNVASMVVFEGGEPTKKEYRKFKIKTVEGSNDFACMREVILRRITKLKNKVPNFSAVPDLILIDGGLGQLHSANDILMELGVNIPIISLAEKEELVFTVNSSVPIRLPKENYARRLLERVRDEAHRFAVSYHRNLRGNILGSKLQEIEGIGKTTSENLWKRFKTMENLMFASVDELKGVSGVGQMQAEKIYNFLHSKDKEKDN